MNLAMRVLGCVAICLVTLSCERQQDRESDSTTTARRRATNPRGVEDQQNDRASDPTILNLKHFTNSLGMDFVLIPAGEFEMGSKLSPNEVVKRLGGRADWYVGEHPVHRVRITRPFYLGRCEVTVRQFQAFVEATGHRTDAETEGWCFAWTGTKWDEVPSRHWQAPGFPQGDDHPVVCVSWTDAQNFCDWLGQRESRRYRLPTEAEWEYSCRAGCGSVFWWGDAMDETGQVCNVADRRGKARYATWEIMDTDDQYIFTSPVGFYQPNRFGLYDMIGNVWEWCQDWYADDYYANSPVDDPRGPSSGDGRVVRGGAWHTVAPSFCRCAVRSRITPSLRCSNVGFRVALDASENGR